jgi:DNA invertase Pin-like site-specific DNA recombinase
MAEFERSLIRERVKAGLRNAKAKGRRLGRPRVVVDRSRIAVLRNQGLSWSKIGETLVGEGTVRRAAQGIENYAILNSDLSAPVPSTSAKVH